MHGNIRFFIPFFLTRVFSSFFFETVSGWVMQRKTRVCMQSCAYVYVYEIYLSMCVRVCDCQPAGMSYNVSRRSTSVYMFERLYV
jgi:hypothetical protein